MVGKLKPLARWMGVFVSALSVLFAVLTYFGLWNELRGDNLVAAAASRVDKSYSQDASLPVRDGDKEWPTLMRLIRKYSHADLSQDKKPLVLARFVALTSAKQDTTAAECDLRQPRR